MKTTKDDRRSRRTRQLLANALIELMLEKAYDEITIQNILDRADIGRSTFYAHYTDKDDLLMSQIAAAIHPVYTGETPPGVLPSLTLFQHAHQHRRLLQAFVWGRGTERLVHDFQTRMSQMVEQHLRSSLGDQFTFTVPLRVAAHFVAGTFFMLLRWWFEENMQHTPEQMDAMFHQLVMPSIKAIHQQT